MVNIRNHKDRNKDNPRRDFGSAETIEPSIDKAPSEADILMIEEQELALRVKELAFESLQRNLLVIDEKGNWVYYEKKRLLAEILELKDQAYLLFADIESRPEVSVNVELIGRIRSLSSQIEGLWVKLNRLLG